MEIVRDAVSDDGVAGVVASLGTRAQRGLRTEDVNEFAFAFIAPLGSENDGGHGALVAVQVADIGSNGQWRVPILLGLNFFGPWAWWGGRGQPCAMSAA